MQFITFIVPIIFFTKDKTDSKILIKTLKSCPPPSNKTIFGLEKVEKIENLKIFVWNHRLPLVVRNTILVPQPPLKELRSFLCLLAEDTVCVWWWLNAASFSPLINQPWWNTTSRGKRSPNSHLWSTNLQFLPNTNPHNDKKNSAHYKDFSLKHNQPND